MKKRLLAILFSLTLVISMFTGCGNGSDSGNNSSSKTEEEQILETITLETAEANGVCGEDAYWYYKDNVLVIKGTGKVTSSPWREVEEFNYKKEVSWLIIDEGITSLPDEAFPLAEGLSKIVFPSSLKTIGKSCFFECVSLSKVTFPQNIKTIKWGAFDDCESLTTLEFLCEDVDEVKISGSAFVECPIKKIILVKESETLTDWFGNEAEFEYTGK